MLRTKKISLLMSVLCAGAMIASAAQARTINGAAGESLSPGSRSRFSLLDAGVAVSDATPANPLVYNIPVQIDTGGNKFFGVRGSGSGLSCVVRQRGPASASDVAVPISSPTGFLNIVNVNVLPGNSVVVQCTFTGSSARLLLVDHGV